jgi:hypothetical protein
MSEKSWHSPGATLSHNNACKEFGLTEQEVLDALKSGKLQYQINYAHGNPYYKLLRHEVESLVIELRGPQYVETQKISHQLQVVNRDINSLKRKLASLEKQKAVLMAAQKALAESTSL